MNLEAWLGLAAALGAGLGYGIPVGVKRLFSNGAGKRLSEPPPATDRERRRAEARAAGFEPGQTGRFEALNSLGAMRCDGHAALAQAVEGLHSSVAAAASAASVASAAAMRIEESAQRQHEEQMGAIHELSDTLGDLREWKGGVEQRVGAVEREIERMQGGTR